VAATPEAVIQTADGPVNPATGELPPTPAEAVATIQEVLGGQVINDQVVNQPVPTSQPGAAVERCDDRDSAGALIGCGKEFTEADSKYRKISRVRFRGLNLKSGLCQQCYDNRKG
jgi:hypothetical protein